jgi:hypothetical protein
MTIANSARSSQRSNTSNVLGTACRYVGGRRGLLLLAGVALTLGLVFKWNWLVAVGVAPVLLSLLPCAAMCALGFCMYKVGTPAARKLPSPEAESDTAPDRNS